MKRTAFYNWMLPDERRPGRMRRSRWQMTEAEAAKYPGAVRIDASLTWRDLPESIDEHQHTSDYQRGKLPGQV
jgi:hypothetical protein